MIYYAILGGVMYERKQVERDLGHRKAEHFFYCQKKTYEGDGGVIDHFTRYGSTQWSLCTKEVYEELTERYNLREWSGFREYEDLRQEYEDLRQEYEDLRQEYEDLRPVHHLDQNHKNVWQMKRDKGKNYHSCQKPINILERLIRTHSNEDAIVLDCFMGSGSTGLACLNTNRQFIGIELDEKYYKIAQERINETKKQTKLM